MLQHIRHEAILNAIPATGRSIDQLVPLIWIAELTHHTVRHERLAKEYPEAAQRPEYGTTQGHTGEKMQGDHSEINFRLGRLEISMSLYGAGFIPTEGKAFFVLRSLNVAPLREGSWIKDVVGFQDWENPVSALAAKIRQRGFDRSRIGVDLSSHALMVQTFETLKRELPSVEFVDVDGLPWKVRIVKSAAEIGKLRKASTINDATMKENVEFARPGFTERRLLKPIFAIEAIPDPMESSLQVEGGTFCTDIFTTRRTSKGRCFISSSFLASKATAPA